MERCDTVRIASLGLEIAPVIFKLVSAFGFFISYLMAEDLSERWKFLKLTEEEENIVIEINRNEEEEGRSWLVGKLHTEKPFSKNALKATMKLIWKLSRDVDIMDLENDLFLFKFENEIDKGRVLDGAPWTFDKLLLMLQEFNGDSWPEEYVFKYVPF